MGIPAPTELILILLILVVVFGGKKIPEIMGSIGQGIKTFKKSMESEEPQVPPQEAQPSPQSLTEESKTHQPGEPKVDPK
ncbi:MAG: twin-arginine translocase TatA/TatE family subunit [Desulfomonilaceae bacterium]